MRLTLVREITQSSTDLMLRILDFFDFVIPYIPRNKKERRSTLLVNRPSIQTIIMTFFFFSSIRFRTIEFSKANLLIALYES